MVSWGMIPERYRTRLPRAERACEQCGKIFLVTVGGWQDRDGLPRRFCSNKCNATNASHTLLARRKASGEWNGVARYVAIAFANYPHECAKCGTTEKLHVHHLDHNRRNEAVENLMILCVGCHHRHHGEKTECKQGHPKEPGKRCKVCVKAWNHAAYLRRRSDSCTG